MVDSTRTRRIRVAIVDDHPMVRVGTQALLQKTPDIEVIGVTGDGVSACRLATMFRPNVLVLDVRLPDISGIEVARRVRAEAPEVAILVLTGYDEVGYLRALLKIGVQGYLRKTASGDEIIAAIRALAMGMTVLDSAASDDELEEGAEPLTSREREVLRLLVAGRRNGEIAERLALSQKTVEFHVSHILQKLGARSRAEAIRSALERGIVLLDRSSADPC